MSIKHLSVFWIFFPIFSYSNLAVADATPEGLNTICSNEINYAQNCCIKGNCYFESFKKDGRGEFYFDTFPGVISSSAQDKLLDACSQVNDYSMPDCPDQRKVVGQVIEYAGKPGGSKYKNPHSTGMCDSSKTTKITQYTSERTQPQAKFTKDEQLVKILKLHKKLCQKIIKPNYDKTDMLNTCQFLEKNKTRDKDGLKISTLFDQFSSQNDYAHTASLRKLLDPPLGKKYESEFINNLLNNSCAGFKRLNKFNFSYHSPENEKKREANNPLTKKGEVLRELFKRDWGYPLSKKKLDLLYSKGCYVEKPTIYKKYSKSIPCPGSRYFKLGESKIIRTETFEDGTDAIK